MIGELLPRHIEIFSNNDFFRGVTIPKPQHTVGIFSACFFASVDIFNEKLPITLFAEMLSDYMTKI